MRVVIQDANVLIDLESADLLSAWFKMGIETLTTDLVLYQINSAKQPKVHALVQEGILRVLETSGRLMNDLMNLQTQMNKGLEIEDVSALYWAGKLKIPLLTGDKLLAKAARQRGVIVFGTLWIFDTLIEKRILAPAHAAEKLSALLERDRRLPFDECQKRIDAWKRNAP
jgi:predicted nucleic acid-binding protein